MKRRKFVNPRNATALPEHHVYGVHAVAGWLRVRPGHLQRLHYDAQCAQRLATVLDLATAAGVALQPSDDRTLTTLAGTKRHQGLVAATRPFPYVGLATVLAARPRLLVAVDQMQDPHNLGALLRTAAAVGAGAVITPKDGSVPVTPTVEAVAAGTAALVPICYVTNVVRILQQLKQAGYWIVGLSPRGHTDLYEFECPERVVVVIGGETGIRPLVERNCDFAVSIPMFGKVESLNASVAAGVALYEVRRRWKIRETGEGGSPP